MKKIIKTDIYNKRPRSVSLHSKSDLKPKFKSKVKVVREKSNDKIEILEENLKNNTIMKSNKKSSKEKKSKKKTYVDTLVQEIPLYIRQTRYRRKTIF